MRQNTDRVILPPRPPPNPLPSLPLGPTGAIGGPGSTPLASIAAANPVTNLCCFFLDTACPIRRAAIGSVGRPGQRAAGEGELPEGGKGDGREWALPSDCVEPSEAWRSRPRAHGRKDQGVSGAGGGRGQARFRENGVSKLLLFKKNIIPIPFQVVYSYFSPAICVLLLIFRQVM